MPGGDRTGPLGLGPMTGRGAGFCAGNPNPGYAYSRFGRRFGRGRGFGHGFWGRGRRFWYGEFNDIPYVQPTKQEQKNYLEELLKNLEEELKIVKQRIQDLSKEKTE